ncbi:UNVERIFIED_CONTAM: hypothetical protein HDU68_004210, partial [Siphonaria sp. JEL0065]
MVPSETVILDYLLYLELEMKRINIVPVATDLEELLTPRIENVYETYKNLGIQFRHEFNTFYDWIRVDPVRIEQVVLNALVGPMKYLNQSHTVLSTITIKSVTDSSTTDTPDSTPSYYLELILQVCGIDNVSDFRAKVENLLHPFKEYSSVITTESENQPSVMKSEDTLTASPMTFKESLAAEAESPTTLSFAIAHGLTSLMNGNASLLSGHKRVTLHYRIPVEICSTAQVIASSSIEERRPRRRIGIMGKSGYSLPASTMNTPMEVVLDLFPDSAEHYTTPLRKASILKRKPDGSVPEASANTLSRKS